MKKYVYSIVLCALIFGMKSIYENIKKGDTMSILEQNIEALTTGENLNPSFDCPGGRYACILVQLPGGQYKQYYQNR